MAEPITKPKGGDVSAEIAAALEASKYTDDESAEVIDESYDALDDDTDPEVGKEGETPSTDQTSQDSEAKAEEETPAKPLPDSYWGTDLTGVPEEAKAAIIAHFESQDSTIRKLQERLATPVTPDAPPATEEATEPTDDELLVALGLDPEDFQTAAMKAPLVLMARNQLALEDQVAQLRTVESGRAVENQWTKTLDELEASYGKLPGTREQQLRYAGEENISSPADLYFKLSAPIKREVDDLAAKARREAEKKVQSATVRPRSSNAEPPAVTPGMSMREAVAQAAKAAQKETGMSWKQAVKRVITAKPVSSE